MIKHKNSLLFIQNSMEIHMKEPRKVYKYKIIWCTYLCKSIVACRLIKHINRLLFVQNSMEIHMKIHKAVNKYEINWFKDFQNDYKLQIRYCCYCYKFEIVYMMTNLKIIKSQLLIIPSSEN